MVAFVRFAGSIAPGKPERLHGAFTARVGRSSNRGGGIDADWPTEEITKYVMAGMRSIGHVLTWQACVDRFGIDDGILTSINEAEAEYTKALKERVFVRDETRVRRYRVLEDAPLPPEKRES